MNIISAINKIKKISIRSREYAMTAAMLIGSASAVILGSFSAFAAECEALPDKLFRLHILANSDSREDQSLKYALRDYLLDDVENIFKGCVSAEEAKQRAKENLSEIAQKSKDFIKNSGYDYKITASTENIFFTTRRYGSLVVPAGNYDALRITIGEGKGQNWWCVMFPPLCLGSAQSYEKESRTKNEELLFFSSKRPKISSSESEEIEQAPKVAIKFAIFEWLEKLFNRG